MVHREFTHGVNFLFTATKRAPDFGNGVQLAKMRSCARQNSGGGVYVKIASSRARGARRRRAKKKVDYFIHSAGTTLRTSTHIGSIGRRSNSTHRRCPASFRTVPNPKFTHHTLVIFLYLSLHSHYSTGSRGCQPLSANFFHPGASARR